jgi:hypothetical protein
MCSTVHSKHMHARIHTIRQTGHRDLSEYLAHNTDRTHDHKHTTHTYACKKAHTIRRAYHSLLHSNTRDTTDLEVF